MSVMWHNRSHDLVHPWNHGFLSTAVVAIAFTEESEASSQLIDCGTASFCARHGQINDVARVIANPILSVGYDPCIYP